MFFIFCFVLILALFYPEPNEQYFFEGIFVVIFSFGKTTDERVSRFTTNIS